MTREIKFRCWDNKYKKWYDAGDLYINMIDGMLIREGDEYGEAFPLYYYEDPIIQQYTGLKDRNDIEIYEGDILIPFDALDNFQLFENQWDSEISAFRMFCHIPSKGIHGVPYIRAMQQNKSLKIIGNILENPELLKRDK